MPKDDEWDEHPFWSIGEDDFTTPGNWRRSMQIKHSHLPIAQALYFASVLD